MDCLIFSNHSLVGTDLIGKGDVYNDFTAVVLDKEVMVYLCLFQMTTVELCCRRKMYMVTISMQVWWRFQKQEESTS